MTNAIDQANLHTMRSRSTIRHYLHANDLYPSERAALASVAQSVCDQPILDIGVGGGRTIPPLLKISSSYLGVDYSSEMVDACRQRHPNVNVMNLDARRMDGIANDSMSMVMFSCNGLCMVTHEDRLGILREVFRVLRPGGVFLFSTFNQDSPEHSAGFRFPKFFPSYNPAILILRMLRFLAHTAISLVNRARLAKHEVHTSAYSIINDVYHDFGTMEYYISLPNQRIQLEAIGFEPNSVAYDGDGQVIASNYCSCHELFFVACKPM
jgi:SAM-dependent methyltransferase